MSGQSGTIRSCNGRSISYNISTTSGQSGSPVFRQINENFYVIGIHSQGGDKD